MLKPASHWQNLALASATIMLTAAPASACPAWYVYMTVFEVRAVPEGTTRNLVDSLVANAFTQVVPMKTCIAAKASLGEEGFDRENRARVIDIACEPCSTRKQDHDRNMEERRVLWYNYAREALQKELDIK